jgi:predicted nucleic acid-binding Zn ribbon protein
LLTIFHVRLAFRGDTPFCSEECRRKQIETEKARHRRKKQNSPKAQATVAAAVAAAAAAQRESEPQLRRPQLQ